MAKSKPPRTRPSEPPKPPPPLEAILTAKFKQEVKLCKKRGKDMAKLRELIETLRHHRQLEPKHSDHALGGNLKGLRDCHVEPDWVLIYRKTAKHLVLSRTGTHSDLFKK